MVEDSVASMVDMEDITAAMVSEDTATVMDSVVIQVMRIEDIHGMDMLILGGRFRIMDIILTRIHITDHTTDHILTTDPTEPGSKREIVSKVQTKSQA